MAIKLSATLRARNAILGFMATLAAGGYVYSTSTPVPVSMAVELIVKDWEGLELKSHWDKHGQVWDICYGETKDISPNMTKTPEECRKMLVTRLTKDFYPQIVACAPELKEAPDGYQAAMLAGAYNFGVGSIKSGRGWCGWGPGKYTRARLWKAAVFAQSTITKSGGQVLQGLVLRHGMGDKYRMGEAELALTALEMAEEKAKEVPK